MWLSRTAPEESLWQWGWTTRPHQAPKRDAACNVTPLLEEVLKQQAGIPLLLRGDDEEQRYWLSASGAHNDRKAASMNPGNLWQPHIMPGRYEPVRPAARCYRASKHFLQ